MLAVLGRLITTLVAVCLAAAASGAVEPRPKAGDPAPDFTIKMAGDGPDTLTLSSLRGKYVLLVIMTKLCRPCKADIPTINEGYKRLAGDKFTVLAVVLLSDRDDVLELVGDHDVVFPAGCDRETKTRALYGVKKVPTSFLIDPQGMIVSRDHGTARQLQQVEELLAAGEKAEALLREARGHYRAGRLKAAYARCRQAVETDPRNVWAHVLLGDICRRAQMPAKAVAAYEGALQRIHPEDYAELSGAYGRITGTYVAAGDYPKAVEAGMRALEAIDEAKYTLRFHGEIGLCYAQLGNQAEARAALEKFTALYGQVDAGTQRRYARLYKSVLAERQRLAGSGSESSG
jgi:peroxiredoxin